MTTNDLEPSATTEDKLRAAKLSISLPDSMIKFIDAQCDSFGVGRSTYLQMLLEAEQHLPRKEFTRRARH